MTVYDRVSAGAAIKKLEKLAHTVGATLDIDDGGRATTVNVDAPHGKVWRASACHALVVQLWPGANVAYRKWNADTLRDAQERLKMGLADCEEKDCDVCE